MLVLRFIFTIFEVSINIIFILQLTAVRGEKDLWIHWPDVFESLFTDGIMITVVGVYLVLWLSGGEFDILKIKMLSDTFP